SAPSRPARRRQGRARARTPATRAGARGRGPFGGNGTEGRAAVGPPEGTNPEGPARRLAPDRALNHRLRGSVRTCPRTTVLSYRAGEDSAFESLRKRSAPFTDVVP